MSKHFVQVNFLVAKSIVHSEQVGGHRTHLGNTVPPLVAGSPTEAALHFEHSFGLSVVQVSQFGTVQVEIQVPFIR